MRYLVLSLLFTAVLSNANAQKFTFSTGEKAICKASLVMYDAFPKDDKVQEVRCGDRYLYYAGTKRPSKKVHGYTWRKRLLGFVQWRHVPLPLRLHAPEKSKFFRLHLRPELCGEAIEAPVDNGAFYLTGLGTCEEPQHMAGCCDHGPECLRGCDPCDAFARYRVTYDLSTHQVCVQRRVRKGAGGHGYWRNVGDRIMRPGVNRLIDVKFANYNALRDSVSLEYAFDDLNQENRQEFVSAMLTTPPAPTPAQSGGDSTPASEPAKTDSTQKRNGPTSEPVAAIGQYKKYAEAVEGMVATLEKEYTSLMSKDQKIDTAQINSAIGNVRKLKLPKDSVLDLDNADYTAQLKNTLNRAVEEGFKKANRDTLEKKLSKLQEKYTALTTKMDLQAVGTLLVKFRAKYEEEKDAPLTPDRAVLRAWLTSEAAQVLPKRLDLSRSVTIKEQLADLVTQAEKLKLISDEQKKQHDKDIAELQDLFLKMTTYRIYALAPIQLQDYDRMKLQFKVNGKALNASPYEIHTNGGWKIDFSTGVVISDLRDRRFFYGSVRTETVVTGVDTLTATGGGDSLVTTTREDKYGTIEGTRTDDNKWGLAVLAHFYPRTGTIFNAAFTLGALLKQDGVSLLIGGSGLFGRRQRLAVTFGGILANTKGLKPGFKEGSEYLESSAILNGEVPQVEDQLRWGGFVGITYNFAGTRLSR